jgi:hypothetical protein
MRLKMAVRNRAIRLQIMLDDDEVAAIEDWRFRKRMPSRASAVREIIRRGLAAEGFKLANMGQKSSDFGVISAPDADERPARKNGT